MPLRKGIGFCQQSEKVLMDLFFLLLNNLEREENEYPYYYYDKI